MRTAIPLVVIVGETASGKSALAMDLALEFDGEIIAGDSRTVYRGLNIGTAKPSLADRQKVKHHLLDVVGIGEKFTVADFKHLADETVMDIGLRNKLPIMVGGSGLYIDSVLFDYKFSLPSAERDFRNPRHLRKTGEAQKSNLRPRTLVVGLVRTREDLSGRIAERVDAMVNAGLVDEARKVGDEFGWDSVALQAPAYKAMRKYLEGAISLDDAKALFVKYDLDFAKRQRTWFKRNKSIHWLTNPSDVYILVRNFLNNHQT
jgi:tRNA dimethylallyltransferase